MTKQFWLFLIVLLTLLSLSLFAHDVILNKLKLSTPIHLFSAYAANAILAVIIFIVIEKLRKTHTSSLGFIFMGGSLFKFLIFFLVFQPIFKADGEMNKAEFFYFFTPYALSLIVEVIFLIKLLNTENT